MRRRPTLNARPAAALSLTVMSLAMLTPSVAASSQSQPGQSGAYTQATVNAQNTPTVLLTSISGGVRDRSTNSIAL